MTATTSPGGLLRLWSRLAPLPGGRWLFSRLLGWRVPYSGTVRPRVMEMAPGRARVRIRERRRLRQHLGSVHAAALFNAAELAGGLAMIAGFGASARGIPVRGTIDYLRKGRGVLTAEGRAPSVDTDEERSYDVEVMVRDATGAEIAQAVFVWRVGPRPTEAPASSGEASVDRA